MLGTCEIFCIRSTAASRFQVRWLRCVFVILDDLFCKANGVVRRCWEFWPFGFARASRRLCIRAQGLSSTRRVLLCVPQSKHYLLLSFCVSVYPCSPHACNGAFVLTSRFRHGVSLSLCEGWARDMLVVCVFCKVP